MPGATARLGILPLVDATFAVTQAQPITGQVDFATLFVTATATFDIQVTGAYTIPPLQNCGLSTAGLNLVIAGDGNTFTGTFSPPPPPIADAGADAVVGSEATFDLDGSASPDPENRPITPATTSPIPTKSPSP